MDETAGFIQHLTVSNINQSLLIFILLPFLSPVIYQDTIIKMLYLGPFHIIRYPSHYPTDLKPYPILTHEIATAPSSAPKSSNPSSAAQQPTKPCPARNFLLSRTSSSPSTSHCKAHSRSRSRSRFPENSAQATYRVFTA